MIDDVKCFIDVFVVWLNLIGEFIWFGYEDVWYYLWCECWLFVNVDLFDVCFDDEFECVWLCKVFEQQFDSVVGYVLLVKCVDDMLGFDGLCWQMGLWFFCDE